MMRLFFMLAAALILSAGFPTRCPAMGSKTEKEKAWKEEDLANGYALLYGITSKEKNLDMLLVVKTAGNPTKELVNKITILYSNLFDYLEGLEINRKKIAQVGNGLPVAETSSRVTIEQTKTKQLLGRSGREFDLTLLSSQIEALAYSSALLDNIAKNESSPSNRRQALDYQKRLDSLQMKAWEQLKSL
jgi:hypothetical protein